MFRARASLARHGENLLLGVLLLILAIHKIRLGLSIGTFYQDGCYYMDVARQVRDGLGLSSYLSLYHQGFSVFPGPTPIYPMWPLLLGLVGRAVDLRLASIWLPTLGYFAVLVGGYAVARRYAPRPVLFPWVNAGHLWVLVAGCHRAFFAVTSQPYTEALAYCLVVLSCWLAHGTLARGSWRSAFVLGLVGAGVYLSRSQLLLVPAAQAVTLLCGALCVERKRYTECLLAFCGALTLGVLPQLLHVMGFAEGSALWATLRFDQFRATDVLSRLLVLSDSPSIPEWIWVRLRGLWLAFQPHAERTYAQAFGVNHYVLPAWLVLWGATARTRSIPRLRAESLPTLFIVVLGVTSFGSLHVFAKDMFSPWNFHTRHGVVLAFAVVAAWAHLGRLGWAGLWLGRMAFVLSVVFGLTLVNEARRGNSHSPDPFVQRHAKLISYLNQLPKPVVVAIPEPQRLSCHVPEVGMHWLYRGTTLSDLRALFSALPADYLIHEKDASLQYLLTRPEFDAHFVQIAQVGRHQVYRPR